MQMQKDLLTSLAPIHWIHILARTNQPAGHAKPDVLDIHAASDLAKSHAANDAVFCDQTSTIRSPRTALQDLLVASVHARQHPGRAAVEHPHGRPRVFQLVLSYRFVSECICHRLSYYAWRHDVPVDPDLPDVHIDVHFNDNCWY